MQVKGHGGSGSIQVRRMCPKRTWNDLNCTEMISGSERPGSFPVLSCWTIGVPNWNSGSIWVNLCRSGRSESDKWTRIDLRWPEVTRIAALTRKSRCFVHQYQLVQFLSNNKYNYTTDNFIILQIFLKFEPASSVLNYMAEQRSSQILECQNSECSSAPGTLIFSCII